MSCTIDDGVALVTLDRPEAHNALTVHMLRRFTEVTAAAQADGDVRVIVVTGRGTGRSAPGGAGRADPAPHAGELDILTPDPTKRFLSDVDKPVVAAVNGLCLAGGLELLLGTDIRIAADTARFGLPEVRWGLVSGAGTHVRLPQQVPWAFAMQLLLTGDHVPATRAYEMGLVNEVLPGAEVLDRALAIAGGIARNGPLAVRAAKEIAVRALHNEPRFALEYAVNHRVVSSDDAREGPRAFVEERAPDFRGS